MPTHAAFLRGINVTGRRVTNDALRSAFETFGLRDVNVFRASGNVVFDAGDEPAGTLAARIEAGLLEALGYAVVTFLRAADDVRAIAAHEPFPPTQVQGSAGKLHVAILAGTPPGSARDAALKMASAEDLLAFGDRGELYWLPSGGFLESSLDRDDLARLLGPMTFRTKGTIEHLARKYFGASP